jgi:hypothetical protein
MGIVTWASIKCELLPKIQRLFFVPAKKLEELIDCAYRLLRLRLGDEFFLMNYSNLAYLLGRDSAEIRALKQELPSWVIVIGVAGRGILPEERVSVQENDIRDVVQEFGRQLLPTIPGVRNSQVLNILFQPSRDLYWKLGYKNGCQDIFFLTVLNKTSKFVQTMYSSALAVDYPTSDIGIYIQPQHLGVAYHCEFSLPYDPADRSEALRAENLFLNASEALIRDGGYFSRPYGPWADMVYKRDAQSTIVLKEIKKIFDPNHVLNPGKLCF